MAVASEAGNSRTSSRLPWVGILVAIAVLVAFRLRAFGLPLETDECNYAYIGARLLAGDRLYVDVWDHQPFGVFALFALVIALFGDAPVVFRLVALAFSIVSLAFIALILQRTSGRQAAILGAALFALASSDPGTGGEGCNREIYMNTLILAAWYFAIRAQPPLPFRERVGVRVKGPGAQWPSVLLSGLLLALASTLKPIVAIYWLLLALWLVARSARTSRARAPVATLAVFAAGPLLVWIAAFSYFAATDRFSEFVDAALLFNVGYSETGEPFYYRFFRFFKPVRHPFIFESALPLWITGAAALVVLVTATATRRQRDVAAIIPLAAAGYLATCLSGRFWPHYYYLLVGPAVLAVAVVMESLVRRVGRVTAWRGAAPAGLFLLVPGFLFYSQARHYLFLPSHEITVKRYNFRDFWGRAQGANVASVTEPDDSIFVYGNDAEIYYYSGRRCASRYTMITGLAAGMPKVEQRRRTLIEDLERHLPRVIIVLFDEKPFKEWLAFLEAHYGPAVGVDYHDQYQSDPIMFVFARKDRPIRQINWDWDRKSLSAADSTRR